MSAPDRRRRIDQICEAALDRDPADRLAFVAEACGGDEGLRHEVNALLAHAQAVDGFLEQPVAALAARVLMRSDAASAPLVGRRLGVYEIRSLLGAGGMGEVYRAHDTTLGRDVAVKILPPDFASDADRLARFEREARLLAALNHPHIGAIYGVVDLDGIRALVLELIEGPTLEERLASGPLSLDEALRTALQIATALEAAHEKGVVHRDLKPSNVKVDSNGNVKLLDFGLAKAVGGDQAALETPSSPTITGVMTKPGAILGTVAYMSPEQARGHPVDKRADIWAFGCVLFEMVTGTPAFKSADLTETLVAVVSKEPGWHMLPPAASSVRPLLARCLKKDVKQRLQAIGDARIHVTELMNGESEGTWQPDIPASRPFRAVPAVVAGLAFGTMIGAIAMWATTRTSTPSRVRSSHFAIVPPPAEALAIQGADRDIAISADGRNIVYRAEAGRGQLLVRPIDSLSTHPVGGTNARDPFFSPDGQWVGYFDALGLNKVPVAGGSAITIWKELMVPRGATWAEDNSIVFASRDRPGLLRVSATGELTVLAKPDATKGEAGYWYPSMLPGGGALLFTITAPDRPESAQVAVVDLKTGTIKSLIRGGSQAEYVAGGYLLYAASNTLRAVRFDVDHLQVLSDPIPVIDDVWMGGGGATNYAVSRAGTLIYVQESAVRRPRSLVWVDRKGQETAIDVPARLYDGPRLSPDGTRVAVSIRDQQNDIWIWDLTQETLTPLTFDPRIDDSPVWTSDSRRIAFASQRAGVRNVFIQSADGSGVAERLTTSLDEQAPGWVAPDGTGIVGWTVAARTKGDIAWFPIRKTKGDSPSDSQNALPPAEPLVMTAAMEYLPEISPNQHYMAYQSNETGRFEIYVRPFPHVNDGRWQVSTEGGTKAVWAPDGHELFYIDSTNILIAVPVQTSGGTFVAGHPTKLFEPPRVGSLTSGRDYDVAANGERFLMIKEITSRDGSARTGMIVIENWFEELKAKLAAR